MTSKQWTDTTPITTSDVQRWEDALSTAKDYADDIISSHDTSPTAHGEELSAIITQALTAAGQNAAEGDAETLETAGANADAKILAHNTSPTAHSQLIGDTISTAVTSAGANANQNNANALTDTVSGITVNSGSTSVGCPNVSPLAHRPTIRIHGNTVSGNNVINPTIKIYGKNHIVFPYFRETYTVNGISQTSQSDGGIVFNGTATASCQIPIVYDSTAKMFDYVAGQTMTFSTTATMPVNTALYIANSSLGTIAKIDSGAKNVTFTMPVGVKQVYLYIKSGTVLANLAIYPQLEIGAKQTAYEQYTAADSVTLTGVSLASGQYTDVTTMFAKSPSMTVIVTDENYVLQNVDVTYNQDLVAVIADLKSAIAALS